MKLTIELQRAAISCYAILQSGKKMMTEYYNGG